MKRKNTVTALKLMNYTNLLVYCLFVDFFLNGSVNLCSVVFFFMFVVASFSKSLFQLSIAACTFFTALYIPVMLKYGPPSFSMSIAMFYTHEAEAWGFITSFPTTYYLLSIAFILFSIFVASRKYDLILGKYKIFLIYIIIFYLLISPIYMIIFRKDVITAKGYTNLIYYGPVGFVAKNLRNLYLVNQENDVIKSVLSQEDTWDVEKSERTKDMHIVVIGESVRRDFMHAYGFRINNTPFMSSSKGVMFENFISVAPATVASLLHSLCQNDELSFNIANNIVSLAKRAGMNTNWFSNQGYVGLQDTPIASIGRLSDNAHFLLSTYENRLFQHKDEELLPWIKEAIADRMQEEVQLIVIHLAGSHFPFCNNTDGQYDEFYMTDEISCYVQSIKNTDRLLEEIYSAAVVSKKSFNMIYFSDHGLNFTYAGELVHGGEYKENYDVPLFLWSDDAVSLDTISAARSGADFLTLFSQLTGIYEKSIERSYCFISNDVAPKISVFNRNYQSYCYDQLKDDSLADY